MSRPVGNGPQGARAALAVGGRRTRALSRRSRDPRFAPSDRFGRMVGRSTAMQAVFDVLGKASSSEATILLEGETGTGKEVSAEAIHRGSPRRDKPFLVVDCGAMPPQPARERAVRPRARRLHGRGRRRARACSRRPPAARSSSTRSASWRIDLQPKLLRVLERREVRRVGTQQPRARRTCASSPPTNRSLREQVAAHKFRSDLYYRLAVVEVKLPPLRERAPGSAAAGRAHRAQPGRVDEQTLAAVRAPQFLGALRSHNWPGNIRELRNYLERCVALRDFAPPRGAAATPARPPAPRARSTSASRCARRARAG